jgi:hypothetical protein
MSLAHETLALVGTATLSIAGCSEYHSVLRPCPDGHCDPGLTCERGVCRGDLPDAAVARDAIADLDATTVEPRDGGHAGVDSPTPLDASDTRDAPLALPPPEPDLPDAGPREPSPTPTTCALPGTFADVALDWERHRVWLTRPLEGLVSVVRLSDCTSTDIEVSGLPEHVFFEPFREEIFVTSPMANLDARLQDGRLIVVDAIALTVRSETRLPLHPWDVVSDGTGRAYVSGAFWDFSITTLVDVELSTGTVTLSPGPRLPERAELHLHPRLNRVYATTDRVTPTDVYRLNPGEGIFVEYDSPYHGEHETCGDLRIHPSGHSLFTACGAIHLASDARSDDMTWVAELAQPWSDLAFSEDGASGFFIDGPSSVSVFDVATLAARPDIALPTTPRRIFVAHDYILIVYAGGMEVRPLPTP